MEDTAFTRPPLASEPFEKLLRLGTRAWDEFCDSRGELFHHFIPADQRGAADMLRRAPLHAHSFLELGSGVGVITILADLFGFDSYGIEIEDELYETSLDLADQMESKATFVQGSFVPPTYRDDIEHIDSGFFTVTEGADAYAELGLEIADFDLIYAYPWPGEELWMSELIRRHASPHARMLTYSGTEGYEWVEISAME